jgi:hypothetical protein
MLWLQEMLVEKEKICGEIFVKWSVIRSRKI